jgi:uncharacterized YigZ family protein
MQTLTSLARHSQEIKKSRFLAVAAPVADEAGAKDFIASHSDFSANHNCWAWRVGQTYRFSDDGEPSGTAGKPILQAIDGQDLDHVAVVVIRWFGGVLLGSGGLMRAYGGTAAQCLQAAGKQRLVATTILFLDTAFTDLAVVKARLERMADAAIVSETFTATGAILECALPVETAETFGQSMIDLTRGRLLVTKSKKSF